MEGEREYFEGNEGEEVDEYQQTDEETEAGPSRLGAMRAIRLNASRITTEESGPIVRMAATRNAERQPKTQATPKQFQPKRDPKRHGTLAAEIMINGVKAYMLFDSGSTTDSITPEFAHITKAPKITLDEQVTLQLGCVGSRSKICYGTLVPINIGTINKKTYFDIVNLDRYDCIIGTPFMNEYNISLDFGRNMIKIGKAEIMALTYQEDTAVAATKASRASIHCPRTNAETSQAIPKGGGAARTNKE